MCASSRTGSPHPDNQTEQLSEQVPCLLASSDDTYTSNASGFIPEDQVLQSVESSHQVSVNQLLEERLQTLDARHGIESGTWDWHVISREEKVLRTDKPIRMRVRWDCHRCRVPMDRDKRCTECQHSQCPMCPRNPPVRHDKEPRANLESRGDMGNSQTPIMAEIDWNNMGVLLNRPSQAGGQELVHKPPRQRVRRMCHMCEYTFIPGNKTCESCGHVRCSDCPRDPSRREKYPFGYPGDEFGPNSFPVYECIQCRDLYPIGAQHGTPCESCGCLMSAISQRARPRAVLPRADPSLLEVIRGRINAVGA